MGHKKWVIKLRNQYCSFRAGFVSLRLGLRDCIIIEKSSLLWRHQNLVTRLPHPKESTSSTPQHGKFGSYTKPVYAIPTDCRETNRCEERMLRHTSRTQRPVMKPNCVPSAPNSNGTSLGDAAIGKEKNFLRPGRKLDRRGILESRFKQIADRPT
jgi:hypothetical protein